MTRSLTFKAGILAFANASHQLVMLIIAMILSRYLSISDYGSYQQLIILYTTFLAVVSFGIPPSINYFLPRTDSKCEKKAYVVQSYILLLSLGLLFGIIFFFLSGFISQQFNNPQLNNLIKIFIWFIFFLTPIHFINQLLVVLDKTLKLGIYKIIFVILRLAAVIIPVLMKSSLTMIISSLVIFSLVQFIITTYMIFKPFIHIKTVWKKSYLFSQLKYSSYIGLSSIVGILTRETDKIVISIFFLSNELAVYANGARQIPFIGILTGSVISILMPLFVKLYKENNVEKMLKLWHKSIKKIALILFPITILLMLFAKEIMILLFSVKYIDSANIFRIYLLLTPIMVTTYSSILMAINKTKIIFQSSFYALIINIIANIISIKLFGIIGPAIASVIVILFLALFHLYNIKKELKITFYEVFPWKTLLKILFLSLIPLIFVFFLKLLNINIILSLVAGGVIYSILYFIIILIAKEITFKELKKIITLK